MSMPSSAVTNATNTNITVNLVDSDDKLYLIDDYPIEQVSHHYWLENSTEISTLYVNNEEIIRTTSDPLAAEYGNTILGTSNPYEVHELFSNKTTQVSSGSSSTSHSSGGFRSDATITRSADTNPYFANDVYGTTFELTGFGKGSSAILTTVKLLFNIATLPRGMSGFSLFLYSQNPTTIPDNAAFSIPATDKAILLTPLGIYLNAASLALGGGLVVIDVDNRNIQIPLTGTSVWGRLVTHGSFTPASPSETVDITTLTLATADVPQAGYKSSAVSIRAATSGATATYAQNDIYGSTFQLSGIGIPGFAMVTNVSLMFNIPTLPTGMGAFLLFLYKTNPTLLGDNDAFSIPAADKTNLLTPTGIYLGITKLAIGGGLVVLEAPEINRQIELAGTSVWGRLVTINSFAPTSPSETVDITVQAVGI